MKKSKKWQKEWKVKDLKSIVQLTEAFNKLRGTILCEFSKQPCGGCYGNKNGQLYLTLATAAHQSKVGFKSLEILEELGFSPLTREEVSMQLSNLITGMPKQSDYSSLPLSYRGTGLSMFQCEATLLLHNDCRHLISRLGQDVEVPDVY